MLINNFKEGRQYLIDQMDVNGYEHKGEAGNFIFIKTKTDAEKIVERVSIGEKKYMEQFWNALIELDK